MSPDQAALLNFFGNIYGQTKELDNHIAAAGSNAAFGNKSADLKNMIQQVVATPPNLMQQPADIISVAPVATIQPLVTAPHQPVQQAAPAPEQEMQLEFTFKEDVQTILKDIYNVLFDIKKLLQAQQQPQKKVSNEKRYQPNNCCLCGSTPRRITDNTKKVFTYKCTGCAAEESGETPAKALTEWNKKNSVE